MKKEKRVSLSSNWQLKGTVKAPGLCQRTVSYGVAHAVSPDETTNYKGIKRLVIF